MLFLSENSNWIFRRISYFWQKLIFFTENLTVKLGSLWKMLFSSENGIFRLILYFFRLRKNDEIAKDNAE